MHPQRISGILVHKAHRVVETSSEAFILRIYREGNRSGFVKGFTDEPEALLAGFGRLEKVHFCMFCGIVSPFVRRCTYPLFRVEKQLFMKVSKLRALHVRQYREQEAKLIETFGGMYLLSERCHAPQVSCLSAGTYRRTTQNTYSSRRLTMKFSGCIDRCL